MEKATDEMDLDEWEFLSDDGFLDFQTHEDVGKGLLVSTKLDFNPKGVFDMNYFKYPSPNSRRFVQISEKSSDSNDMKQLVSMPIELEGKNSDEEKVKEVIKVPIVEINKVASLNLEKIEFPNLKQVGEDQELISQVFFKKMKENEFVDIKMDSPKSGSRGIKTQIEAGSIQFEEKKEAEEKENMEKKTSTKVGVEKEDLVQEKNYLDSNIKEEIKWEGGLNIWKWRLTGIGALCSIGMAAATICIFFLGSQQRQKHHQQNQKLRFQIYTDDKRIKQVVHHATKMNQAISAVRGVPITRAHITFGGYYVYDGL